MNNTKLLILSDVLTLAIVICILVIFHNRYSAKLDALYDFYEASIDLAKQTDEYNIKVIEYNHKAAQDQKKQILK